MIAQHDPILYVYSESACNKFEHLTPTAAQKLSVLIGFSSLQPQWTEVEGCRDGMCQIIDVCYKHMS